MSPQNDGRAVKPGVSAGSYHILRKPPSAGRLAHHGKLTSIFDGQSPQL